VAVVDVLEEVPPPPLVAFVVEALVVTLTGKPVESADVQPGAMAITRAPVESSA
jgi:hypothetical protein